MPWIYVRFSKIQAWQRQNIERKKNNPTYRCNNKLKLATTNLGKEIAKYDPP